MANINSVGLRMPGLREGESANSRIKEYKLSEEELEKYRTQPIESLKRPVVFKPKQEEETRMTPLPTPALKKDGYLQLRFEGKTTEDILKLTGWKETTLKAKRSNWGIYKEQDELAAVEAWGKAHQVKADEVSLDYRFEVYEKLREEGKSQPEIAQMFGMHLEDLKWQVKADRQKQEDYQPAQKDDSAANDTEKKEMVERTKAEDTKVPDEQENPSEEPQRSDRGIVNGVGREAPQEINETGGKQSHVPFRFDLLDAHAMFAVAKVLDEGERKYGKDNWRKISVESHLNHLLMHIFAYMAGDEQDEHLEHALTRAVMAVGVKHQS